MAEAAKEKKKGGRKPLWEVLDMPSRLDAVRGWALQGSTDEDIYTMLGISETTFYEWKAEKPEFAEAIKKGKYVSNGELLNSAFEQSIGFTYIDNIPVKVKSYEWFTPPDGGSPELKQIEKVVVVPTERYAPPNPTMSIFMIKNRLPEHYKDKQEIESRTEVVNRHEYHIEHVIQNDQEAAEALKTLFKRSISSGVAPVGDTSET